MKGKTLTESWPVPRRTTPRAYFEERVRGAVEKALALPFAVVGENDDPAMVVQRTREEGRPDTAEKPSTLEQKRLVVEVPFGIPCFIVSTERQRASHRAYTLPEYREAFEVFDPEEDDVEEPPRLAKQAEEAGWVGPRDPQGAVYRLPGGAYGVYTIPNPGLYRVRVLQATIERGPLPPAKARPFDQKAQDLVQITFAGLTNAPRLDESEPEEMEYEVIARSRSRTRALEMFDRLIDELKNLSSVDIDSDGELRTETGEHVIPIAVNYVTRVA